MRDGTRAFFQMQGIFHYFRAFKTEILHIYSPDWANTKTIYSPQCRWPALDIYLAASYLHFGG